MYEDIERCGGFSPTPAWMTRCVGEEGIALIKEYEGLRLRAYRCPGQVWTIGYGHTRTVHQGMAISLSEAELLLKEDLFVVEQALTRLVSVPLTDTQFGALASFVFNVGIANFERSTLLKLLNRGWYEQVPAQLTRWNKVSGVPMGGLARRRAAEGRLWNARDDIFH